MKKLEKNEFNIFIPRFSLGMCKENDCKNQSRYNYSKESKALYCSDHKKDGKKILSSFKNHKTLFVPIIRQKKELDNRLNLLKETINKWLIKIPEKEITNEYLFYN
jgi:hypothetical protein